MNSADETVLNRLFGEHAPVIQSLLEARQAEIYNGGNIKGKQYTGNRSIAMLPDSNPAVRD